MEILNLHDRREQFAALKLIEDLQFLYGILNVGDVFYQSANIFLLTINQLQNIHPPLLQPLLPLLLQLPPPADQLDAVDIFQNEPSPALVDGVILLADQSVTEDRVVAVHCH